jgi:hypothetical protein
MSRQRDKETSTGYSPPWIPETENESLHFGGLYPDTSQMGVCFHTTQQLGTQGARGFCHEPRWR